MKQLLNEAEELINAGQCDEAVELLCRQGVPEDTRVCELIARCPIAGRVRRDSDRRPRAAGNGAPPRAVRPTLPSPV